LAVPEDQAAASRLCHGGGFMSLRGGHLYLMMMETYHFLLLIDCWLALLIRSMRMMETPGFLH
jgi:hypothetical protein